MTTPDTDGTPADVLPITDEEWIAASQACCGRDADDDDDPPAIPAPPGGTP